MLCSSAEEAFFARTLGARLAAEAGLPPPASIATASARPGDTLLIDGLAAPSLDAPCVVEPGDHDVAVHRGSRRLSQAITVGPGEDAVVEIDAMDEDTRSVSAARLGIAVGGVGAALAAAGAILVAFDGDCASTTADAAGNCAQVHHTAIAGWAVLGTGIATLAAGVTAGIVVALRERRSAAKGLAR
jgi:hypothetical protein